MSYRDLPAGDDLAELLAFIRKLADAVTRLENTAATTKGVPSFASAIQIGDVTITVTAGVGDARVVTFRNVLTGSTDVINLP